MLISDVRPWGGERSDVELDGDRITAIRPHAPSASPSLEGRGRLLFPSFSDVHVHLDSTRIGLPFRPHTGGPGVVAMMTNDRLNWRSAEVPLPERVAGTLERMIGLGTTRVRSYAQVDVDCRLEKLDAVLAAREKYADQAEVQVMAFAQAGILREPGTLDLLDAALRSGATVIGGIDPCTLDRDPKGHLDAVFALAEKHQAEIDIHLHEPGHLGLFSTDLVIDRVRALDMRGKVTMSHAYDLGSISESVSRRVIDDFASLDIAMTTVAPSAASTSYPCWTWSPRASASAWARTASGITGAPTATATYWTEPGNWPSPEASAATRTSSWLWRSRRWVEHRS